MAQLHPPVLTAVSAGEYREVEMLRLLADVLPAGFDIYHGVHWSQVSNDVQRFGEIDAVVLSPTGHLALLEIKAGEVDMSGLGVFKQYGGTRKNVAGQAQRQLHAFIGRLREVGLQAVFVNHFLLLPDFRVAEGSAAYPRERIIDATDLANIGPRLIAATRHEALAPSQLHALRDFLSDRFSLAQDAACRDQQRQAVSRRLSSGLATWVPRIQSPSGLYVVDATAGSGKTQLALQLMKTACAARERAAYVCFNRPLADHIARLAPPAAEVCTVHEMAVHALRASGVEPDFTSAKVFEAGIAKLASSNADRPPGLDLLVIDEAQDFDPAWIDALLPRLRSGGRMYLLGDTQQAIYAKEAFGLADATQITCHDNFRSPRRLVEAINHFRLTDVPVRPCGIETGEAPEFHVYAADDAGGLSCLSALLKRLTAGGHCSDDIAVLSFRGRERSRVLRLATLAGHALRRFTGTFDAAGNAMWTEGTVQAESIYRFKGQSAPIVILCEMDFEALDDANRRKLFVAMTRAQRELHLVMSEAAAAALEKRLDA